jgi:hypothetical protein
MQLNTIGKITVYASGYLFGSGLGYLLSSYILRKILEEQERIQEELTDPIYIIDEREVTKEEYDTYLKEQMNPDDNSPIPLTEKELKTYKNGKNTDYANVKPPVDFKPGLDKVAAKYVGESVTKEPTEEALGPYIISFAEYANANSRSENRRISIVYYEGDKTLADELEVKVNNPEQLVGPNALASFGTLSEDPDIVYIRNNKLGMDIEISRSSKSYDEAVLGKPAKKEKEKDKEVTRDRLRRQTRKGKIDDDAEEE